MLLRKALIISLISLLAACSPSSEAPQYDGEDGLKNGLIEYPPDSEGYVTSAFRGVKVYSATAMHYICTVIAVRDGYEPTAMALLAKSESENGIKINAKASGLLLKDANNWYDINVKIIDTEKFYDGECRAAIENTKKLYG